MAHGALFWLVLPFPGLFWAILRGFDGVEAILGRLVASVGPFGLIFGQFWAFLAFVGNFGHFVLSGARFFGVKTLG